MELRINTNSLVGKKRTGSIGKSRLSNKLDHIIENKIHSVYLTKSRKSITKTIREIELECNNLGITAPHPNTIRNRIKILIKGFVYFINIQ